MNKNNKKETEIIIDNIKNYLNKKNLDYYDIRLEHNIHNNINIENKLIKNINETTISGVGIRIIYKQKMGFCSTTNFDNYKEIIDECIRNTQKINKKTKFENVSKNKDTYKMKYKNFEDVSIKTKIKEMLSQNKEIIKQKNIKISNINYIEIVKKKYFINPYSYIYQEIPYVIYASNIVGKKGNIIEQNRKAYGNVGGLDKINYDIKQKTVNNNIKTINELLISKQCPALKTNILISPELSDLLAHEAIGHASEGDIIVNKASILKKNLKLCNNKYVNIIDDPTLKEFGHYKYDDEGIKARKKVLIKEGIVNEHLLDITSATILKQKSNGSARAEDFTKEPIVRMSNTYFDKGNVKLEEILKNFNGYLLDGFRGGQVEPSVGTFMFGISQAYKIENGKITQKYKQASISGKIIDYLKNIKNISNKLGEYKIGFCGKGMQTAFVSGNGPYIEIKNAVLGGTEHEL